MSLSILLLAITALVGLVTSQPQAADDPASDLASYISRPELRAPLLNITRYDEDLITPGYLFVAPYAELTATDFGKEYVPYQGGPHIYDSRGELIWSGARLVRNRNTFDFRLSTVNNAPALTFILGVDRKRVITEELTLGGIVLSPSYSLLQTINITQTEHWFDMHELAIVDSSSCLSTALRITLVSINSTHRGRIIDAGFREISVATGLVLFEWWASDHIPLSASMLIAPSAFGSPAAISPWDPFHTNSVDKDPVSGNYLISMRYTSAVYLVSATDGSILWSLGGRNSTFPIDPSSNLTFSSQHDAKFLPPGPQPWTTTTTSSSSNPNLTIISLLDNASDEKSRQPSTANTSSVKIIALSSTPPTATLLALYQRPDGLLTPLRGSAQILPHRDSVSIFAGWSTLGYMSEHTASGLVAFEARYAGDRFNSYRAYKFADFVGTPAEPPKLVVRAYASNGDGGGGGATTTLWAVSWNGATAVRTWVFLGSSTSGRDDGDGDVFEEVGRRDRAGFETTFADPRFWAQGYAQALAANGSELGSSIISVTTRVDEEVGTSSQRSGAGFSAGLVKAALFTLGLILGCLASTAAIVVRRGAGSLKAGAGYRRVGRSGDEMSVLKFGGGGDGLDSDKDA